MPGDLFFGHLEHQRGFAEVWRLSLEVYAVATDLVFSRGFFFRACRRASSVHAELVRVLERGREDIFDDYFPASLPYSAARDVGWGGIFRRAECDGRLPVHRRSLVRVVYQLASAGLAWVRLRGPGLPSAIFDHLRWLVPLLL